MAFAQDSSRRYTDLLILVDVIFGLFIMGMMALALASWWRGATDFRTVVPFLLLFVLNQALSLVARRFVRVRFEFELFRFFVVNGALCSMAFLWVSGPLAPFWYIYVLMVIGFSPIAVDLSPDFMRWNYGFTGFQILNLLVTTSWKSEHPNWFQAAVQSAAIAVTGVCFSKFTYYLNESLRRESEEKAQILALDKALDEQRALAAQHATLAALGEMAGGVAHEVNTPLATIRMLAEQIADFVGEQPVDQVAVLEAQGKITQTVDRISEIVQGLRNVSRQGDSDPPGVVGVERIVRDTLLLCEQRFRSGGVRLDLSEVKDFPVRCRPVRVSQALLGLLGSAFGAAQYGTEKWVKLSSRLSPEGAHLVVADSGLGTAPEERDRVMRSLSVCRGLVEEAGGILRLDEGDGRNTFVITLPFA